MNHFVKSFARRLCGEYWIYKVFAFADASRSDRARGQDVVVRAVEGADALEDHASPAIRRTAAYAGSGAKGFVALIDDEIVGVCWFWAGERLERRGWPALPTQATELVQITVAEAHRSRGIAARLIADAGHAMRLLGYGPIFARVWHSHHASSRAFHNAGWRYERFHVAVVPFGAGSLRHFSFRRNAA